jgi:SOS-response transcriptional repressor LexA
MNYRTEYESKHARENTSRRTTQYMPPGTTATTARQDEILAYIKHIHETTGRPPTFRMIGEHFGIKSPNGVRVHLLALAKKGLLTHDRKKACGYMPVMKDAFEVERREDGVYVRTRGALTTAEAGELAAALIELLPAIPI